MKIKVFGMMAMVLGMGVMAAVGGDEPLKGRVSISGAWALYPMVVRWAEEFRKINPDVIIDISAGGAGKGMADALSGAVDLGMVSREITPVEVQKGAWSLKVVRDAVLPMMNANNPLAATLQQRGLVRREFTTIWMHEDLGDWSQVASDLKGELHVYTRSDACGAAQTWAAYLGGQQENLQGTGVYGDPGLAEAVRQDAFGVGYNNVNFAMDAQTRKVVDGLAVIPIDVNENGKIDPEEQVYTDLATVTAAIANGRYPSPPARDLYLVAKGVPANPLARAFLKWALTDGQKFVEEAGYINLKPDVLSVECGKLKP